MNVWDASYVALCMAFIAAAPVLNASTVSVVALAPSNSIIWDTNPKDNKLEKRSQESNQTYNKNSI